MHIQPNTFTELVFIVALLDSQTFDDVQTCVECSVISLMSNT